MANPKVPAAPRAPAPADPDESAKRADAPAKIEADGAAQAKDLKKGAKVRVCLTGGYPMWCSTQNKRITPGEEPEMIVDKWVLANVERGNLRIVS